MSVDEDGVEVGALRAGEAGAVAAVAAGQAGDSVRLIINVFID